MKYISTRGQSPALSFSEILLGGLAPDGGLYLPESYPQFNDADLTAMRGMNYRELAFAILISAIACLRIIDLWGGRRIGGLRRSGCRSTGAPAVGAQGQAGDVVGALHHAVMGGVKAQLLILARVGFGLGNGAGEQAAHALQLDTHLRHGNLLGGVHAALNR